MGHFRVPKTLTFKMRPSAQPFLWKWVLIAYQRLSTSVLPFYLHLVDDNEAVNLAVIKFSVETIMRWLFWEIRKKGKAGPILNVCFTEVSFNRKPTGLSLPYRGGSRGRVQGVRTPPPPTPEMTCGSLIQLVFCQKKNNVVCPGSAPALIW